METLFDDEFINNKVLKRLIREIKEGQILRTVKSIDRYRELQKKLNNKYGFSPSQNEELEMLRRRQYARRNLQA